MAASILTVALFAATLIDVSLGAAVTKRQSVTALSQAQISAFKPYTHYASTAYCTPSTTLTWTCGANCDANSGFLPTASGGDGAATQYWYVGWDASESTVIVGHQGTQASKIIPVLTDGSFFLTQLDSTLFPGLNSSIEVHNGFAASQARSAADVLAAVQSTLSAHSSNSVTVVGHSLGAAIALLDSVYLPLHLPSTVTVKTVGYGMPRVGNKAFADYVDAHLHVTHINNKVDPVPIVPGRFLGFVHPAGEVHINGDSSWDSCPGQDNTSSDCIVGAEPSLLDGDSSDHSGPYDGVTMGCS